MGNLLLVLVTVLGDSFSLVLIPHLAFSTVVSNATYTETPLLCACLQKKLRKGKTSTNYLERSLIPFKILAQTNWLEGKTQRVAGCYTACRKMWELQESQSTKLLRYLRAVWNGCSYLNNFRKLLERVYCAILPRVWSGLLAWCVRLAVYPYVNGVLSKSSSARQF